MDFTSFVNTVQYVISKFPPVLTVIIVSGLIILIALAVKRIFF